MPDGDEIHKNLKRRYHHVYKQVCEGHYDSEVLADRVLDPLKRDLHDYGDAPLRLIEKVAEQLGQQVTGPLMAHAMDVNAINDMIDRIGRETQCNLRAREIAFEACKQQVQELRAGQYRADLQSAMTEKYFNGVYKANFDEAVPLNDTHHASADQQFVEHQLTEMRPLVGQSIKALADQAVRNGTVRGLRVPGQRGTRRVIDLNMDLLAVR